MVGIQIPTLLISTILKFLFHSSKHVARGPDSIFRSVADVVFATQRYKDVVKEALVEFQSSEEGLHLFDESNQAEHKEARALVSLSMV